MNIVWHKHTLMIFPSFVYGHPVKYSYEISNQYLSGSMAISLFAFDAIFSENVIFGKATSSHFFRVTSFKVSQELLFRSSSFFRATTFFEELLLQNSHFFTASFIHDIFYTFLIVSAVDFEQTK